MLVLKQFNSTGIEPFNLVLFGEVNLDRDGFL